MNLKLLLTISLLLLLSTLVSCQMLKNKKLQSAGSTAYCSNCLVKNLDKDIDKLQRTIQQNNPILVKYQAVKTPIEVRSVIVFDKNGEPVCHVDLLKHPDLIPDFAQPSSDKTVYQTNKSQRNLASVESDLPPCTEKYLKSIKKVATNNVVVNGAKPYKHKTSFGKYIIAPCALGIATSATPRIMKKKGIIETEISTTNKMIGAGAAFGTGAIMSALSTLEVNYLTRRGAPEEQITKHVNRFAKGLVIATAAVCYVGTEISMAIFY